MSSATVEAMKTRISIADNRDGKITYRVSIESLDDHVTIYGTLEQFRSIVHRLEYIEVAMG